MFIDDFVLKVNAKLGVTQVLYAFVMLLWPISMYVFPKLKSRRAATLLHLIYGVVMCYCLFQARILFAVITSIIGYFIIELPPHITFVIAFAINCGTHIYHLIHASKSWSMEVTGTCIVIFQKIVATAFNIDDGRRIKKGEKMGHRHFAPFSLEKKPSFLEWMAFCLTPLGGSTGPFFEFKLFELSLTSHERPPVARDSVDHRMAIFRYIGSIGWALATLFGFKFGRLATYYNEAYLNSSLIVRNVIMVVVTMLQAIKYYSVWWAVEAACFEFGFLSSPLSETRDGDYSFSNLSFGRVLMSTNTGEWMQRWNHSAHLFWKHYLFCRILGARVDFGRFEKFRYSLAHNAVFFASALWHGFKPVYYLALPEVLIDMNADARLNKKWPVTKDSSIISVWLHRLFTIYVMLASTCTWWYSTAESFFYVRKTLGWLPQIFAFAVYVLTFIIPGPKKAKKPEEKPIKKEEKPEEKAEEKTEEKKVEETEEKKEKIE